jgi:hypothetical protein
MGLERWLHLVCLIDISLALEQQLRHLKITVFG